MERPGICAVNWKRSVMVAPGGVPVQSVLGTAMLGSAAVIVLAALAFRSPLEHRSEGSRDPSWALGYGRPMARK